jgi:hypothetical protein
MRRIALVHLVRRRNDIEPFRRFLASYRAHDPGMEHDLAVIFKGFRSAAQCAPYRELLAALPHRELDVPDRGYDITAYWMAAERLDYGHFCFLNSFSTVRAPGWLESLYRAVAAPGIGVAGTTGSYQSLHPAPLKYYLAISKQIRHRGPVKDFIMSLPFAHQVNLLRRKLQTAAHFREFPNYHVRTNSFIIGREIMRAALRKPIRTKMDAYRFESGRHSLTTQVLSAGMNAIVVGANGGQYAKEAWHLSETFWQGRQQNLLVEDNQTRQYDEGSGEVRHILSTLAWGPMARPE